MKKILLVSQPWLQNPIKAQNICNMLIGITTGTAYPHLDLYFHSSHHTHTHITHTVHIFTPGQKNERVGA